MRSCAQSEDRAPNGASAAAAEALTEPMGMAGAIVGLRSVDNNKTPETDAP
jgi:hypothetical protein